MTDRPSTRCWRCGTKLVDEARLLNERRGVVAVVHQPTGKLVCPYRCPTPEEAEEQRKEGSYVDVARASADGRTPDDERGS